MIMPIITIYPSRCTLHQGDYVAQEWIDYRFVLRPYRAIRTDTGFVKVRVPERAILVKSHYAELTADEGWVKLMDGKLYCAWHVYLMAERGKRGLKFVVPMKGD